VKSNISLSSLLNTADSRRNPGYRGRHPDRISGWAHVEHKSLSHSVTYIRTNWTTGNMNIISHTQYSTSASPLILTQLSSCNHMAFIPFQRVVSVISNKTFYFLNTDDFSNNIPCSLGVICQKTTLFIVTSLTTSILTSFFFRVFPWLMNLISSVNFIIKFVNRTKKSGRNLSWYVSNLSASQGIPRIYELTKTERFFAVFKSRNAKLISRNYEIIKECRLLGCDAM
jgi:hypothetical protein